MRILYIACHEGTDGRDGGVIAYFLDKTAAQNAIKGAGPSGGGDGHIREEFVYDSLLDYNDNKPEAVRKRALAKLSPEEIKVLGIK